MNPNRDKRGRYGLNALWNRLRNWLDYRRKTAGRKPWKNF